MADGLQVGESRNGFSGKREEEGEIPVLSAEGQLSYIGQDCDAIPLHLVDIYGQHIKSLHLSYNNIRCLIGLEAFPFLEELVLDDNDLRDDLEFPPLPHLHTLTLNKNKLKDLDRLLDQLVVSTPNLCYLSLLGNEACPNQLSSSDKDDEDYQRYRYYVLYRLPKLKFLDSSSVKPKERTEAERQGPFLKVVRPKEDHLVGALSKSEEESQNGPYTPLPQNTRQNPEGTATYGKCKYVYYGKHSEGNRFIRNNDL